MGILVGTKLVSIPQIFKPKAYEATTLLPRKSDICETICKNLPDIQICGGLEGKICPKGMTCITPGNYPDAQGVCIPLPPDIPSPNPSMLPSATITSVNKTNLSDGEDVIVNFTTNGIANLVNLRIDKVESFSTTPPAIQVKLIEGATTGSIVWPATHIAHTLGFHEVTLHPYYCSSLDSQGNPLSCTAGPISNSKSVEMIGTTPVSDTELFGHCAASDRFRYKAGRKTTIYCPGAWRQEAQYKSICSADNENPYYYDYCREEK